MDHSFDIFGLVVRLINTDKDKTMITCIKQYHVCGKEKGIEKSEVFGGDHVVSCFTTAEALCP